MLLNKNDIWTSLLYEIFLYQIILLFFISMGIFLGSSIVELFANLDRWYLFLNDSQFYSFSRDWKSILGFRLEINGLDKNPHIYGKNCKLLLSQRAIFYDNLEIMFIYCLKIDSFSINYHYWLEFEIHLNFKFIHR